MKELILKRAREKEACNLGINKFYYLKTKPEIEAYLKINKAWCRKNKLLTDQESIKFFGLPFNKFLNT